MVGSAGPHLISSGLSLEIVTLLPSPCRCRSEMPGSDALFIDERVDRGSLPRLPPPGRPTSLNSHIEAFILSVPSGGGFFDEGMVPHEGMVDGEHGTRQRTGTDQLTPSSCSSSVTTAVAASPRPYGAQRALFSSEGWSVEIYRDGTSCR